MPPEMAAAGAGVSLREGRVGGGWWGGVVRGLCAVVLRVFSWQAALFLLPTMLQLGIEEAVVDGE